jgi:hypothetical protein
MCKNCEQTTNAGAAVGIVARVNPNTEAETIGDLLNERIKNARKHLEELCIKRAKAEASGLDKFPAEVVHDMFWN